MHRLPGKLQCEPAFQGEKFKLLPAWQRFIFMAAMGASATPVQRGPQLVLLLVALLVVAITWIKGSLGPGDLLDQLARRSIPLNQALENGKPSLVEFYADWCEACKSMAPAMVALEKQHPEINLVMLNVDNPTWQAELQRWQVNGIPHLQLFDSKGKSVGQSVGLRQSSELQSLASSLSAGTPLPQLAGVGAVSSLSNESQPLQETSMAGPRSHA
jgi:thiol:disulfide interchange protein